MYYHKRHQVLTRGFTLVELILCIVIIALLASISTVAYSGVQKRAASAAAQSDLENASGIIERYGLANGGTFPDSTYLNTQFSGTKEVSLAVFTSATNNGSPTYTNLSSVQNAVLFHETCKRVMASDPAYRTIRSHDGTQVNTTYNLWCGAENGETVINRTGYQVNSWRDKTWPVPITADDINNRIANSPTDSWWNIAATDKLFYTTLRDQFLQSGGTFPITTFWDSWATCGTWGCSGTLKAALPAANHTGPTIAEGEYCIEASHSKYPQEVYKFTSQKLSPQKGSCE